ncbi:MAG: hypothetical protein OEY22_10915 [Candidatus Bathyarchaeota archaeon]|nr:hypothetical protein [Candidatus Bathyarchaeota archaeon]MDH5787589.1 hypothetical protein [Candidatus Bathyarchaeota archaeon]
MGKIMEGFLDDIKFFLRILRWKEYWTVIAVLLGVLGVWLVFMLALSLANPWRSIIVWGLIFGLAALTPKR